MEWRISKNPFGMLEVEMDKGETITAEPGALVYMQGDVDVKTSAKIREQGFLSRLKTAMLGRESFFLNDYIARGRCMLGFAGSMIGDIEAVEVKDSYIVQGGSYMASIGSISLDTKFQGFVKGIFGTELFMLKVDGSGTIFVNSYGSLFRKDLKNGERMVIDNYNLVAMNASAEYRVTKIGGIKTFILGGEGLGVEVNGPATVYLQSRNMMELKGELTRLLELDKYVQKGSQPQPQSQPQFDLGLGRERRDWDTPRI